MQQSTAIGVPPLRLLPRPPHRARWRARMTCKQELLARFPRMQHHSDRASEYVSAVPCQLARPHPVEATTAPFQCGATPPVRGIGCIAPHRDSAGPFYRSQGYRDARYGSATAQRAPRPEPERFEASIGNVHSARCEGRSFMMAGYEAIHDESSSYD